MNLYKRTVNFIGLNGKPKSKVLYFQITRSMSLEHREMFEGMQNLGFELQGMDPNSTLTEEMGFRLLRESIEIIKLTYAEVDFDNDIIDQSEEARSRFEKSLAYEALLTEVIDDPMVILDIVKGISNTAPIDDEQKAKVTELQQSYLDKTTIQNGDNPGQTNTVDLEKERKRLELQKQLAELDREE